MSFVSIEFLFFLACIWGIYYIVPQKYRYIVLAVASYGFYLSWSFKYTILLLVMTVITYIGAFFLQTRYKKVGVIAIVSVVLSILGLFKFNGFWFQINLLMPLGLSFYILQSIGYLIDVYSEKIPAERNFLKYSLFVIFFLTIVSGPIERTNNLLKQIQIGTCFSYDKAKKGLFLIVYGYFQKVLIADRIGILVNEAFSNYKGHTGAALLWAVVLYGIQLYTDFAGYSNIVVGAGNLFGFDLIQNFKQPYLAGSIKEFWARWHISLSSWLKDYVYIPLGGSRCDKVKMYRNLMITFLVSAVWHGIGWNYVIWGGLHGIYQVIGKASLQWRIKIKERLKINTNCFSYRLFQVLITFILVDFAWLFFGVSGTLSALRILKRIVMDFQIGNTLGWRSYLFGMSEERFIILIIEIVIVLLIDVLHEKKYHIKEWLDLQNVLFRWFVYVVIVLIVLIGIIYNYGTETSGFIYTRF